MPGQVSSAWSGPSWVGDLVATMARDDLATFVNHENLGPVAGITVAEAAIPVEVQLDPAHTGKAHVLTRWVDYLDQAEPILHRYPRTAPRIRLNVRGLLGDVLIVVYAVYEQSREPEQFAFLEELHSGRGPIELLALLTELARYEPEEGDPR